MAVREDIIQKVKLFASEIQKNDGIKLSKVFLFGSYAKGFPETYSDIDVALVSDSFTGFGPSDIRLFMKTLIKKDYSLIETKTYSTDYFDSGDAFIEEEIKKWGLELHA